MVENLADCLGVVTLAFGCVVFGFGGCGLGIFESSSGGIKVRSLLGAGFSSGMVGIGFGLVGVVGVC